MGNLFLHESDLFDNESGEITRSWAVIDENYSGFAMRFPYIHLKGTRSGSRTVILAGIHGDELNGINVVHRLTEILEPGNINGQIILLPIANIPGFHILSRYLPDRRDLNRLFPGSQKGSEGSRLAQFIWKSFIEDADFAIDLHSASYERWNYPHVRGDMSNIRVKELASSFGVDVAVHSRGVVGSLRRHATENGIPVLLLEAGQSNRFEKEVVERGVLGCLSVLAEKGIIKTWPADFKKPKRLTEYMSKSYWHRSPVGGLFEPFAKPGDRVESGEVIGVIRSLMGENKSRVKAQKSGTIIGINLHPQVVPGRALFHICFNRENL